MSDGKSIPFRALGQVYTLRFDIAALRRIEEISQAGISRMSDVADFFTAVVRLRGRAIDKATGRQIISEIGIDEASALIKRGYNAAFARPMGLRAL